MGKLEEKVALVTGGGRGIGRGIALELAREGAAVVIAELDPQTASQTAKEIEALGVRALGEDLVVPGRGIHDFPVKFGHDGAFAQAQLFEQLGEGGSVVDFLLFAVYLQFHG